jgi:hypothetical protein
MSIGQVLHRRTLLLLLFLQVRTQPHLGCAQMTTAECYQRRTESEEFRCTRREYKNPKVVIHAKKRELVTSYSMQRC